MVGPAGRSRRRSSSRPSRSAAASGVVEKRQVRAVEAGDDRVRRLDAESRRNVGDDRRRGGRGERQHALGAEFARPLGQLQVVGAEVVAPLGDAVRLVDGEERDPRARELREEALVVEALRRHVEQLSEPPRGAARRSRAARRREARVEPCRLDPASAAGSRSGPSSGRSAARPRASRRRAAAPAAGSRGTCPRRWGRPRAPTAREERLDDLLLSGAEGVEADGAASTSRTLRGRCFVRHCAQANGSRCKTVAIVLSRICSSATRPSGMKTARLRVTRTQILAFRRRVGGLDKRLPAGRRSLRLAAWAGLQDSMPRATLSIHARVEGAGPTAWDDPSLVQVWGPRYQVYVVAERDLAVFTLGRLPDAGKRQMAEDLAERLHVLLGGRRMRYDDAGQALGVHGNNLRYAALTGRLAIRWEGARRPTGVDRLSALHRSAGGGPRTGAPLPADPRPGRAGGVRQVGGHRRPESRSRIGRSRHRADPGADAAG